MMKSESTILTKNNPAARALLLVCAVAWIVACSALAQTMNTTTTLESSANLSCFGQPVTFTVTVTGDPGTGTPTGTVDFQDGGITVDTEALDGSGQASFATSTLAAGTHSITAVYSGDVNFNGSVSLVVTQTVNTTAAVTANPANNSVCAGNSVSFTAAGGGTPAPTIQWQVSADGGATFANIPGATSATYTFTASSADNGKQYQAQFSNNCGTATSTAALLTVNALPNCSIAGANGVCASSLGNVFSGPAGMTAYRWAISGSGTISGATNAQSVSVNAAASGSFTLTLTLTNASGCTSTCTKTVANLALPTAVVSGGGTICSGNSANIQAALTGTGPWNVVWSDGFTQSGVAASPATRSVSPSSTTTYTVTALSDANCTGTASGSATVTVNSAPAVTSNPTSKAVCAGGSVSFTASAGGSPTPTIQWQVSSDGGATFANISGATSATYIFTTSGSDNGKQYRAQFSNSCGGASSSAASLTVNALPICSISGADAVCANSGGNPYTGPAGMTSYRWTVTGSGALSGASNAQALSVNAGASGSFTVTLTLTNASGCTSTCSKTVTNLPLPTAVVSGGGTICPGGSAGIQAALTGTSPWTVVWSDGLTQSGVAASPATRSVSPSSTTIYTATSVSDANCTGTASGSSTVTVNSAPLVTSNPTNKAVCAGGSASFTAIASGSPTPTVQWQVSTDGGATFSNVAGATNSSYSVTTSGSDNGKQYRAQFNNSCGGATSSAASLTVNALPVCSVAGVNGVCANSLGNLFSGPAGMTAYSWAITGSGTLSGATNAQSVSVNAGASGSFTLSLTLTNASGCTSTCSKTVTNLPLPTAMVSGGGAICPGGSTNIQAALTGTSPWIVVWSDGLTQSNVTASPATRSVSPSSTTIYSVTTVNDANCSNSGSGSATVTINAAPAATSNPANKAVCAGGSVSFAASASGSPTPAVQWQASGDGGVTFTNIAGATSSTYSFTPNLSDNGKRYRVLFSNTCGSALSSAATLTVNALPTATISTPTVICPNSGGNIASVPSAGAGAGYSWTVSGGTITSGAGTPSITYTAGGGSVNISVTVSNAQGCTASGSQGVTLATQGQSLEAWKNKAPLVWQRSTFNNGDHQYSEGNSIPQRLELTQMCPGSSWCVVLRYDFKDANTGRHFYDFLATYDASEPTVHGQECANFSCGAAPTTFPIPTDTSLAYQLPGNFTVYNGTITNVSTYSIVSGSTTEKQLTISGITESGGGAKDVLILYGGHLAREIEWGAGNGASSFPGASAKVLYQFCGDSSFGNFGVNPGGIVKQADLSITKSAAPSPLCVGNTLTYSMVVSNAGPNLASPVTVLDPLPAGTTLNSVIMSQGSYSGTTSLNFALGTIDASSNATITVLVNVNTNASSTLTNTATVSATAPADPFMANNSATAITAVLPRTSATPLTDQIVCLGGSASFSTIGLGSPPFTYQWTKNGANLAGATTSSFSIASVSAGDVGTYCVIVSGHCGGATNSVTNCAALILSTNASATALVNLVKCPGENAAFSTTPGGTGPFSFVWRKDGVILPGATANALTISGVTAADAGGYCVEISGACGVTSSCATLTVRTNTTASPLSDQTKCPGDTATFATTAFGTGPFSYVWRKDGALLPGETKTFLTMASVSATNTGSYCVEVTGNCNSVTNCATLTVNTTTTADPLISQTNCPGTTVTFSTAGHGTGPFTYQWAKDGAPLNGQTDSSLTRTNLSGADGGIYSVQVTGVCNATTNFAALTVNQNVVVGTAPASVTNCPGTSAFFGVEAKGTGLSYQWFKGATALDNQTNSSLTLTNVGAADADVYSVVVSGVCGNAVTNNATLTVNQNVVVASAPVSVTNCPGTSASFSVAAGGTGLSYQWFKGTAALAGQTGSSLSLPNVSAADAGTYGVVVSGVCGNAVSNSAMLTVNQNTVVSSAPVSVTNCPGTTASFSVAASGTGLNYQWFKGTIALAGQTGSSLTLPSVSAGDAGTYSVAISGVCGNSVSNTASLTVNVPVTADALVSQTLCPGATASFGTVAHGTGPFSYQWLKAGAPLAGQTGSSLTLNNIGVASAGIYSVQVIGACGSVTNSAMLTVNTLTTVDPLASQFACPGTTASFSAIAHGTGPFTYLWRKDGKVVPGGTRSSLALSNVSVLDVGTYTVAVSGLCNGVTNGATLTINAPTTASPMANQSQCFGRTATFSTTPSGTGPFTFVWKKNGNVLVGQTGSSLTLTQLKAADAATYAVEVTGQCNSVTNSATLSVESDGLVSPATFSNSSPITINDFNPATPYPSTIDVSCVPAPLSGLTVTITNLSHTYASDIVMLLVGPSGQATMLMAHAGDGNPVNGATIGFSDTAAVSLPEFAPITTGIYKPTIYRMTDNMPLPAPPSPYATGLSAFTGSDPNGTWSLYVADDNYADTGVIAGGWSLTLNWQTTSAPAVLSSCGLLSDGCSKATLQGQSGKTYVIEASTDLIHWTPILTNTLSGSIWNFVDVNSTNYPQRFYRAVCSP